MSESFTYESPNSEKYLVALLKYFNAKQEFELHELLKNATCDISQTGSYSRKRWDAIYTKVHFYIPVDEFTSFQIGEDAKNLLLEYCDIVMPKSTGLDVMEIDFSPSVDTVFDGESVEDKLEEINRSIDASDKFQLPDDILDKGKEMSEVYLYLYAIENYLRIFIEKIGIENFGQEYFSNFNIPNSVEQSIKRRKSNEQKNRWIRIRGDSDLFYLDFIELGSIVQNNWRLFKDFFPDQAWISSKLKELYEIRNLVAHNSYVGKHERDILFVNFRSIVTQLNHS